MSPTSYQTAPPRIHSLVARRAHNPKAVGSNPAPATTFDQTGMSGFFAFQVNAIL